MLATFQPQSLFSLWQPNASARSAARMTLNSARRAVQLDNKQYVTLADAQGWSVQALSGSVWITQDWDTRDVVLEAGETFVLDRPGVAMISAIGPTRVCIGADPSQCVSRAGEPALAAYPA